MHCNVSHLQCVICIKKNLVHIDLCVKSDRPLCLYPFQHSRKNKNATWHRLWRLTRVGYSVLTSFCLCRMCARSVGKPSLTSKASFTIFYEMINITIINIYTVVYIPYFCHLSLMILSNFILILISSVVPHNMIWTFISVFFQIMGMRSICGGSFWYCCCVVGH